MPSLSPYSNLNSRCHTRTIKVAQNFKMLRTFHNHFTFLFSYIYCTWFGLYIYCCVTGSYMTPTTRNFTSPNTTKRWKILRNAWRKNLSMHKQVLNAGSDVVHRERHSWHRIARHREFAVRCRHAFTFNSHLYDEFILNECKTWLTKRKRKKEKNYVHVCVVLSHALWKSVN